MLYRIHKFIFGIAHIILLVALLRVVTGAVPIPLALAFTSLSVLWMILTDSKLSESIAAFEDRMLRRLIYVPLVIGVPLAVVGLVLAFTSAPSPEFSGLMRAGAVVNGVVALGGWIYILRAYLRRRSEFKGVGSGFLPKNVWLNPPLEAIPDGALILTDGRMARRARNSMGHSELVVKGPDGKLRAASSYIEKGVVLHYLRALIVTQQKNKENYIVLVPRTPWTEEQSARAFAEAERMKATNRIWRDKENERRTRLFNFLPLPARWRVWLLKNALSTGYDVAGKYWGGSRKDRWTCMAANLRVLRAAGMSVGEYGTGAFGLVGEINPMLPIRFMQEPAYCLMTTTDQDVFESRRSKPVEAKPAS